MKAAAAPPLVTDASSPAQTERARRRVRERLKGEGALMRHQLSTYEGRMFVWRELERHRVFEYIGGSNETVREQLGARNEGLRLMAEAAAHPELFAQMQNEARHRAQLEAKERAAAALDAAARETDTEN